MYRDKKEGIALKKTAMAHPLNQKRRNREIISRATFMEIGMKLTEALKLAGQRSVPSIDISGPCLIRIPSDRAGPNHLWGSCT